MKTTSKRLDGIRQRSQTIVWIFALAGLCIGTVLYSGAAHAAGRHRALREAAVDVCTATRFLTYDQLAECLRRVPYNGTEKRELVEFYRRALPQYVFEDIAKKSHSFGPHTIPAVDLQAGLRVINQTTYANDAEMQRAFFSLFSRLNDAHIGHSMPSYFYMYFALQPISIMSIEREGQHVIQISYVDSAEVEAYHLLNRRAPIDTDVVGWDVLSIDGVPAVIALREFAKDLGLLKDEGGRFNLAVSGYKTGRGWYVFRPMSIFALPASRTVVYELRHPVTGDRKTVSFDWIAVNHWSNNKDKSLRNTKFASTFDKLKAQFIQHELYDEPDAVEYIESVVPNAAVLKINSFYPKEQWQFAANISFALSQFAMSNNTKLILDLSGNGGGSIGLGYATLRYLFPSLDAAGPREGYGPHRDAVYRARRTELSEKAAIYSAEALFQAPYNPRDFTPYGYYRSASQRQFLDASWMTPGETTVLGEMSQGFYMGYLSAYDLFPPPGANFKIAPENLVVVSQGYCGSTCAVFASYIQAYGLGSTVALGGYLDTPQQVFGFPGGQVGKVSEFIYFAGNATLEDASFGAELEPLVPRLPTSGRYDDMSYTYLSISPWKNGGPNALPLEYTFVPADYSIMYPGDPTDDAATYAAVLRAATK
ncbi:hypothetical protein ACHHYP_04731 [Achlya hypogyna]|uniref:Tail specific protease domain-containing protein n=1 Tax=Achlya hypogyna TaxID=1202772 RepID=A0A1V9Z055_ACHHY|nr:hypothetical protein ACHHYP_04731 [Achlya hypogyna]